MPERRAEKLTINLPEWVRPIVEDIRVSIGAASQEQALCLMLPWVKLGIRAAKEGYRASFIAPHGYEVNLSNDQLKNLLAKPRETKTQNPDSVSSPE